VSARDDVAQLKDMFDLGEPLFSASGRFEHAVAIVDRLAAGVADASELLTTVAAFKRLDGAIVALAAVPQAGYHRDLFERIRLSCLAAVDGDGTGRRLMRVVDAAEAYGRWHFGLHRNDSQTMAMKRSTQQALEWALADLRSWRTGDG